jgi:GrpB-like predicted nucleotidyltransferase (UPF0157 family)
VTAQPPDQDNLPAWAIERVHLSAYDSRWLERAARYADELRPVLDQWLLCPIEHVGSTSIPGIVAKPVIDLMAQVTDIDAVVGQAGATLDGMSWKYVPPEQDSRPWRRFFAKVSPDGHHRLGHLHLMSAGAARWDQQIRFRDALRANPALRDEYAAIKSRLASTYADERERYTDEKATFVTRVLRDLERLSGSPPLTLAGRSPARRCQALTLPEPATRSGFRRDRGLRSWRTFGRWAAARAAHRVVAG